MNHLVLELELEKGIIGDAGVKNATPSFLSLLTWGQINYSHAVMLTGDLSLIENLESRN